MSLHPDYLWGALTEEQWIGWQLYAKHFGTPLTRGDEYCASISYYANQSVQLKKSTTLFHMRPTRGRPQKRRQSGQEMRNQAEEYAMRMNALAENPMAKGLSIVTTPEGEPCQQVL